MTHTEESSSSTLSSTLKECEESHFPNLFVLLQTGCTLPVTSSEYERNFSVIRRLRTWLQTSINANNANHCVSSYEYLPELFCKLWSSCKKNSSCIQERSAVIVWFFYGKLKKLKALKSVVKSGCNIFIGSSHWEVFFGSKFSLSFIFSKVVGSQPVTFFEAEPHIFLLLFTLSTENLNPLQKF